MKLIKIIVTGIVLFALPLQGQTQVGINTETPDPSAALDLVSTDKGLLIPRLDTSAVANPATGLMVFRPSDNGFYFYNGSKWQLLGSVVQSSLADTDGDTKIQVEESQDEDIIRIDIRGKEKFTLQSDSTGRSRLEFTNNRNNTAIGLNTLQSNTSGYENVATGDDALQYNTTGNYNVAIGNQALRRNTKGHENVATGDGALQYNITGNDNVATGSDALLYNKTGSNNVAIGYRAGRSELGSNKLYIENSDADSTGALIYGEFDKDSLRLNAAVNINGNYVLPTTSAGPGQTIMSNGSNELVWGNNSTLADTDNDTKIQVEESPDEDVIRIDIKGDEKFTLQSDSPGRSRLEFPNNQNNTAIGLSTLQSNTTGSYNVATGAAALRNNTTGNSNVATGDGALQNNTMGSNNVATGNLALPNNTTGNNNVAIGPFSMNFNSTGNSNAAIGTIALANNTSGNNNVATGASALQFNTTGSNNVAIGYRAGRYELGSDKLYIENTSADSTGALIYGEFDKDSLRLNAAVNINGNYVLPTTSAGPGQTIMSNGSNELVWGNNTALADTDGDTKIQVEESPDDDIIRMDINGQEKFQFTSTVTGRSRLNLSNNQGNIAIGYDGLNSNTTGSNNVAIGHFAFNKNTTGSNNVAIGPYALVENFDGSSNTGIGEAALEKNTTGFHNVATGAFALRNNTTGINNVSSGYEALHLNTTGSRNVANGYRALKSSNGNDNTAIGYQALEDNIGGTRNTVIGNEALSSNQTGSGNVAIGFKAGATETGSNKLYINNDQFGGPQGSLIYGDFSSEYVSIDNQLIVGDNYLYYHNVTLGIEGHQADALLITARNYQGATRFQVNSNGNAYLAGTLNEDSDIRLKKDIKPLQSSLAGLLTLGGYNYFWKDPSSSNKLQTGVIAQEVVEVFPELVTMRDEYYSVNYSGFIPHLIEGMKEQQGIIERQESIIQQQETEMKEMKEDLDELKELVNKLLTSESYK